MPMIWLTNALALPYLGKLSLQICTRINHITNCKAFLHLKKKFHHSYVVALFTNFSVVATMLPIMAKLNIILRTECVSTWEFRHSLGKK